MTNQKFLVSRFRGFTLLELMLVVGIIALLAIFSTPRLRAIYIESKIEPTAKDLTIAVNSIRAGAAATGSNTPYTTLGATANATAVLANTASGRASVLSVSGTGATATLQHQLGGTSPDITVAQGTIATLGDSFDVTVNNVNEAACPGLSNQLAKVSEVITLNGTTVKANGGTYNSATAKNACTADDTNDYVFTFR